MSMPTGLTGHKYHKMIQEGWLSPTELASVSAVSLRQNLATSGAGMSLPSPFLRVEAFGYLKSLKRHMLASQSHRYAWDNQGIEA